MTNEEELKKKIYRFAHSYYYYSFLADEYEKAIIKDANERGYDCENNCICTHMIEEKDEHYDCTRYDENCSYCWYAKLHRLKEKAKKEADEEVARDKYNDEHPSLIMTSSATMWTNAINNAAFPNSENISKPQFSETEVKDE